MNILKIHKYQNNVSIPDASGATWQIHDSKLMSHSISDELQRSDTKDNFKYLQKNHEFFFYNIDNNQKWLLSSKSAY